MSTVDLPSTSDSIPTAPKRGVPEGLWIKCPGCGFTQADFKKSGRLGCSECYDTFSEGLDALLKTMHKGTRHTGKVPAGMQLRDDLGKQLKELQSQLDAAVAAEKFERAAELRDDIKKARHALGERAPA